MILGGGGLRGTGHQPTRSPFKNIHRSPSLLCISWSIGSPIIPPYSTIQSPSSLVSSRGKRKHFRPSMLPPMLPPYPHYWHNLFTSHPQPPSPFCKLDSFIRSISKYKISSAAAVDEYEWNLDTAHRWWTGRTWKRSWGGSFPKSMTSQSPLTSSLPL